MALLFAAMACLTAGATRPLLLVQRTSVTRQLVRARRPRAPTTVFARMASTACGSVVEKGGVCNDEGGAGAPPALAGPPVTVGKAVSTGRLRQAPNLPQITRIVKMARKEMYLDGKEAEKTLKEKSLNAKQRCCRLAARKLDVLTKHLVVPLRDYQRELKAFLRDLHPFERELVRLTLAARERMGGPSFVSVLEAADTLRKEITAAGKAACAQCPDLNGAAAATAFEAAQYDLLVEMLEAGEQVFQDLDDVGKLVRSLPSCSSSEPLAVLVGLPNVGKSSLVGLQRTQALRRHSDQGIFADHMDTVPTAKAEETHDGPNLGHLYVLDPTGLGGKMSAAEEQLEVRRELREAFPEPLWIDVLSKSDVLEVAQRG
ncbi:hypothetical protein T492DRAFT_968738 [Pavlovales sp. CCMP2436]|nr:hypothetical protein T492DRAFT_968738 [Pavlovales sp. CCMP2436]